MKIFLTLVALSFVLTGCMSYDEYVAKRTAGLRKMYPAGMTRDEVQSKWNSQPDFSVSRPAGGWNAHTNKYLADVIIAEEASTGKRIEFVERYWGADGLFSLAYCWYYYDADRKIVDVEWEYKSD